MMMVVVVLMVVVVMVMVLLRERKEIGNMTSPIKADSTRSILILHSDVLRAQSKRQLDRTYVSHTCSYNK